MTLEFSGCQIPLSPPFSKKGVRLVNIPLYGGVELPFIKGDLEGFLYEVKNVVAQFIGQLCLMNQATTKSGGEASFLISLGTSSAISADSPGQIWREGVRGRGKFTLTLILSRRGRGDFSRDCHAFPRHCEARPPIVVRPFGVVRTRLKPRTTFLNTLIMRGIPPFVIARSGSDEAIPAPTGIATLRSQ